MFVHLSFRYIPENFYSDLCVDQTPVSLPFSHQVVSMPDYLQTVMAGCSMTGNKGTSAATTTTVAANQVITSSGHHGLQLQVSAKEP